MSNVALPNPWVVAILSTPVSTHVCSSSGHGHGIPISPSFFLQVHLSRFAKILLDDARKAQGVNALYLRYVLRSGVCVAKQAI